MKDQTMNERWIKLYARITEWEWYTDPTVFKLFVHLLIRANFKPARARGRLYARGIVLTSLNALAAETGLSVKNVRTALDKLMSTGEIKIEATKTGSVITVCNYNIYQAEPGPDGTQPAKPWQTSGKAPAICIDINNKRNTEYVVADNLTRVDFIEAFFSENRRMLLAEICRSRGFGTVDNFRRLAEQVVAEWEATGVSHVSVADAARHLISHCAIKMKAEKATVGNSNRGKACKNNNYETKTTQNARYSDENRQEEFRDSIAMLLSTDYEDPDIAGCY